MTGMDGVARWIRSRTLALTPDREDEVYGQGVTFRETNLKSRVSVVTVRDTL